MKTLMMATDPRCLGIFSKRGQSGAGIFSVVSKAAKKIAAKMTKAAAKQVAKKVAKKAAMGAVAGGAGWATTKFFDKYI